MGNTPNIRFKGFTDDWEQRKLGDVVEDYVEKTTVEDQYPVLTSSQQKGIVLQDDYFSGERVSQNGNIGYFVIPRGYFTFRSRSDNDVFVFNRNDAVDMGIISYFYPVFKPKGVNSDFLLRRLNYGLEDQIKINSEGTGQHVLSLKKFKNIVGVFPSYEEQKKIGSYFSQIDHLITLHQRKCDEMKKMKKFMLQKMFPKNGQKNPEIRFDGFTDDWEQRKLGDVVEDYVEKTTVEDQYPVLTSSQQKGIVLQDDYFSGERVSQNGNIGYFVIPRGYFTFRSRSDNDVFVFNRNDAVDMGIISYFYPVFKPKGVNSDFLLRRLNYGLEDQIKINSEGTGQHVLSLKKFKNIVGVFPSYEEQKKIGSYFSQIDHLITLHQRKCDEMKKMKKFMLQKMFPKNGQKNPEIRFDGFTDDWEQRKFKDVFDGLQNNTFSRADLNYESGAVKNVHYGDVLIKFGDFIDVSKDELPFITDESQTTKYNSSFLQDGDIIIADTAEDSTVGKCSEIVGFQGVKLLSGLHTIPCRPKEKYAPKFMGYYINSDAYHKQLIPLMQGIKVTSISKSALQETDMILPKSFEEQAQIGEYFSNIDHLITLHQRKVDNLKNLKKYMLQNMFV